jgi:hypothetical protein
MRAHHPSPDAAWARTRAGVFELDEAYYAASGGVFTPDAHHAGLFPPA